MYKSQYLFSVEKLKKKMPTFFESKWSICFECKSYSTPGFKWVVFLFEVAVDEEKKRCFLKSVTYSDASRNIGDSLISVVHHYGDELFYEIAKDCRIEPFTKDGNIASANSYGKLGFYSENLPTDTDLELFSITKDEPDHVMAYYSKSLGGFLYNSQEINKSIVEFKTEKNGIALRNLSRWNFGFLNKFYLHNNEFYYFVPYDLNEQGQFNLFSFNKNYNGQVVSTYVDNGQFIPMKDLSLSDLHKKLKDEVVSNQYTVPQITKDLFEEINTIATNKTLPFTFGKTEFFSNLIFKEYTEIFKEGEIVEFVNGDSKYMGKILNFDKEKDLYHVETFKHYMGVFPKEKKFLKKVEPFTSLGANEIIIFKDFRGKRYLHGQIQLQSSMGIVSSVSGSERSTFFSNIDLDDKNELFRLTEDETKVFEQFTTVSNHNEKLIFSIINLTKNNARDLSIVFRAILNAMLSCMSIESVINKVVSDLERNEDFFERNFVMNNINIFKKILLTKDALNV